MRIDKEFAPVTIKLTSEEELFFLRQVLDIAYDARARKMWPTRYDDSMCQKIKYFKELLR